MHKPLACLFLSLALAPHAVFAARLEGAESLSITDVIQDDLYAAGADARIDSDIEGDLLLVSGEAWVNANVSQDVQIAAGRLQLNGDVGDDVRAFAGEVELNGAVGGDVFVLGGGFQLDRDAVISGDLYVAGGEVFVDGSVEGDLHVTGGRVSLNGTIGGMAYAEADDLDINGTVNGTSTFVSKNISLGETSLFNDDVRYFSTMGEVPFEQHMSSGTAVFDSDLKPFRSPEKRERSLFAKFFAKLVASVLSAVMILALLTLIDKTFFGAAAKEFHKNFWPSVLYGFLYFAVTPIAALILMLTVIGIPVSLLVIAIYVFSIVFATPIAAFVITKYLQVRYKKKWTKWKIFFISTGTFVVLKIIGSVPLLGWLALLLIVCGTFGATMIEDLKRFNKYR